MAVRTIIDKHGNERHVIDYYPQGRNGRRIVFTMPAGTPKELAIKREQELRARKNKALQYSSKSNIKRLVPLYLAWCKLHESPETLRDKISHFNVHLLPFFGRYQIPELNNTLITLYKTEAQQKESARGKNESRMKIGNRTISKGLGYFSGMLRWAEEDLKIPYPEGMHIKKLPYVRPVPVVLSLDEALAFIQSADRLCPQVDICRNNYRCFNRAPYNTIFKLFFYTGLRKNAGLKRIWDDVNWSKNELRVISKGGKTAWYPLPDDLMDELRVLYKKSKSKYIFPSPSNANKPFIDLKKAIGRAKKKAGIEKRIYLHLLRHSIATHLLDKGVNIRDIQDFLQHSEISTTEWYTQVSTAAKKRALNQAGIRTS